MYRIVLWRCLSDDCVIQHFDAQYVPSFRQMLGDGSVLDACPVDLPEALRGEIEAAIRTTAIVARDSDE